MKKNKALLLALFLVTALLSGCAFPGGLSLAGGIVFAPPSWLIGKWADAANINVYTVSSDNVVLVGTAGGKTETVDFKNAFARHATQESSPTAYVVRVETDDLKGVMSFTRIDDTSLDYSITQNGKLIGPIKLIKQ